MRLRLLILVFLSSAVLPLHGGVHGKDLGAAAAAGRICGHNATLDEDPGPGPGECLEADDPDDTSPATRRADAPRRLPHLSTATAAHAAGAGQPRRLSPLSRPLIYQFCTLLI